MRETDRKKIMEQAVEIKSLIETNLDQKMEHMQYYEDFTFEGTGWAEQKVYVAKLQEKETKPLEKQSNQKEREAQIDKNGLTYAIYDKDQNLIATVGQDGKIQFTAQYKNKLKQISPELYETLNLEGNDFHLPEELAKDDMVLTDDDLAKYEKEQEKRQGTNKEEQERKEGEEQKEEPEKDLNSETEAERKQEIAKTLGIKPEEVKGFAQIDPNRKITESYNLRDIMPETRNYERIEVACATGEQNQGDGRFCILGITKDGTREVLNSVQSIEGVATNKKVISIGERGEEIQEKSVQGLMRINARDREDGISFALGNYGMVDISYVRDVMNKETRRSTPIDTLELENRKILSPEVRENAADDMTEVRKESENFRKKQEEFGKETQDLEDIDMNRNENIEAAKSRIAEETADLIREGANGQQVKDSISRQVAEIPGITLDSQEQEYLISQIYEEAKDLSNFPTKQFH